MTYEKKRSKLLVGILILVLFINLVSGFSTSESITTDIGEDKENALEGTVYEISESILEQGYQIQVKEKDMLKMIFLYKEYLIFVDNISEDYILIRNIKGKVLRLNLSETHFIEINFDGKIDFKIRLNSIEKNYADIYLKKYTEKDFIPGNYKELFDIDVGLTDDTIEDSRDLTVYMKFINFGEGPSRINIVYSILDWDKKEIYVGMDDKVVYTEESIVKDFDFLNLPPGKYIVRSEIFYGDNQTAISEKNFEIIEPSVYSRIIPVVIVIFVIISIYSLIYFFKKKRKKY